MDDLPGWKNLLGGRRKGLSGLKLLPSEQKNPSAGEIKVLRGLRKGSQELMKGLGWRMNLTSGESKGMGQQWGLSGMVQRLNAPT